MIKYIRQLYYLEYYNYTKIAKKLDSMGIPSKSKRKWNGNTIANIINRDPQSITLQKESGKLLSAKYWEEFQGREKENLECGWIG